MANSRELWRRKLRGPRRAGRRVDRDPRRENEQPSRFQNSGTFCFIGKGETRVKGGDPDLSNDRLGKLE